MTKISLFIPTYNALNENKPNFIHNLEIIQQANLYRVLIIDSSSKDATVATVNGYGFETHLIPQIEFDHGRTRQLALEMLSDSDIIIYLTQDALLHSVASITNLIQPLLDNKNIAACFGRQLPHTNADIFATHLRKFNYSETSYTRSYADRVDYGMRCVFASDSFCAYRVRALCAIMGFPKHIIFGEDVYVFAKLLQNSYEISYSAEATCYHSHNYSIWHDFKRYFDIGVFHQSENWILQDFGTPSKQGSKFIISNLNFLGYKIWLWPISFTKILAKYIGYKLGYNYKYLGVSLCRKLSMNKSFW